MFHIWLYNEHIHFMILTSFGDLFGEGVLESDLAPPLALLPLVLLARTSIALDRGEREMHLNLVTLITAHFITVWNILWMVEWKKEWRDCLYPKIVSVLASLRYRSLLWIHIPRVMYIILKRLHAHLDMISTHHCDHYRYPIIDKDIPCCMQPRSSFWIILVFCCSFQEWSQSIQGECVQHHNASLHLHKTKPSCSLLSFPIIISFPFKQPCWIPNTFLYSSMIRQSSMCSLPCLYILLPILAGWQHVSTNISQTECFQHWTITFSFGGISNRLTFSLFRFPASCYPYAKPVQTYSKAGKRVGSADDAELWLARAKCILLWTL